MLTIHDLQVRFDVAGDEDAAVFSRMFAQHMSRWSRAKELEAFQLLHMTIQGPLGLDWASAIKLLP